jgi:hypothetical protein
MGLKPPPPPWASPLQTLTLKTKNEALKTGDGVLPPTRAEIHRVSMVQRPQRQSDLRRRWQEADKIWSPWGVSPGHSTA